MAEQDRNNDQNIYEVVDKIIQNLLLLDPYSRLRVYRTVGTFFGFEASFPKVDQKVENRTSANISREPIFSSPEEPTPKEFLLQKQPKTNVERVACLAYYLSCYRKIKEFKTIDISKLNTEAAQTKLTNPSYAVNDAVKTGYIVPADKGMRQLSANGELYVKALPDRDAAKKFKLTPPKQSRRKGRGNRIEISHGQEKLNKPNE